MTILSIKNTYDIQIAGKPSEQLSTLNPVNQVAVLPNAIPYLKPKLKVKQGDSVQTGTVLFYDKRYPKIQFLSPGTGTVAQINYGPKRVIESVIIECNKKEEQVDFPKLTTEQIQTSTREDIVNLLTSGGVWGLFEEFPFQRIPNPEIVPPAIYVAIDNDEPYHPSSNVYLEGNESYFEAGILALKQLTKTVIVSKALDSKVSPNIDKIVTHHIKGHYPANQTGTVLYHTKKSAAQNTSWGIYGQDVIRIGKLILMGQYPVEKIVVIAGSLAKNPRHIITREGVPIKALIKEDIPTEPTRYIAGGIFQGRKVSAEGFLGIRDDALHLIREGKEPELLSFFRLGFDKPTHSKTYMSALIKKSEWEMTTSLNGGDRSCISCGKCVQVCSMDVYPQLLMKSIYANDIEESLKLGVLDCINCGLCTYVCPSKINFEPTILSMQQQLEKETHS